MFATLCVILRSRVLIIYVGACYTLYTTYILNDDTHPAIRAIGVSHIKNFDLTAYYKNKSTLQL